MEKLKKIKKNKVITVSIPKPEVSTGIDGIVAALNVLVMSEGWQIIRRILDENIKYLEQAILEKQDPLTKASLTDAEVESLRDKRNLNIELKRTPENYSKVVRDEGKEPENYDPFYKTAKEMRRDQGLPPREKP